MHQGNLLLNLVFLLCLQGSAMSADFKAGPDDYRSYLALLKPGDRLLLEGGEYFRGLPLHGLQGHSGQPVIIEGSKTRPATRFIAQSGVNTVSLVNVRHLTIRNLELEGNNQPVDAIKAEGHSGYAHFVTLENLYIHDFAASQQNVGISTKCPAFGWVIRENRIERVGTGMYLGDSDGTDPFVAGVIERNIIRDTQGYNLQIKHQKKRPQGMHESDSRHDTIIRHNVFSKENAIYGQNARPNVLVGHWPTEGEGSEDRYLIHSNLFWHNPSEALFQGEGNIALYKNVFVNASGPAIHVQPHNDIPRHVDIRFNTIIARESAISIRNKSIDKRWTHKVVGNLVFASAPIMGGMQAGNLEYLYEDAIRLLKAPFAPADGNDFGLKQPLKSSAMNYAEPVWGDIPEMDNKSAGAGVLTGISRQNFMRLHQK
jgi:hypothetical protein